MANVLFCTNQFGEIRQKLLEGAVSTFLPQHILDDCPRAVPPGPEAGFRLEQHPAGEGEGIRLAGDGYVDGPLLHVLLEFHRAERIIRQGKGAFKDDAIAAGLFRGSVQVPQHDQCAAGVPPCRRRSFSVPGRGWPPGSPGGSRGRGGRTPPTPPPGLGDTPIGLCRENISYPQNRGVDQFYPLRGEAVANVLFCTNQFGEIRHGSDESLVFKTSSLNPSDTSPYPKACKGSNPFISAMAWPPRHALHGPLIRGGLTFVQNPSNCLGCV